MEPLKQQPDRALDESNRGYRLLVKMGWRSGRGLGKSEQGIVEPVKMKENLVTLGLGKAEEYDQVTQLATSERRKLDVEVEETTEQRAAREAKGVKEQQLKDEVKEMQKAFYCGDCRKQYKTVTEMENHLSSYDHHHTKRLRELQQQKRRPGSEVEQDAKRKRKQKQEEIMLQRRITAQSQRPITEVVKTKKELTAADKQVKSACGSGNGYSFSGGLKLGVKKVKRTQKTPSAFTNSF